MTNYVNSLFWLQWIVIQKTWKSRTIFYEIISFLLELQRYENHMIFLKNLYIVHFSDSIVYIFTYIVQKFPFFYPC